jgi:hypothetical protein
MKKDRDLSINLAQISEETVDILAALKNGK